jgi:hypothetical protein
MPSQTYKTTNPVQITATLGSPTLAVAAVAAGRHDFINDIEPGMLCEMLTVFSTLAAVVVSVDIPGRTVLMSGNPSTGGTSNGYFYTSSTFTVPAGVEAIFATLVGGGQGGAGGHTAAGGGGGGGGGATATFADMILYVVPGDTFEVHVGLGCPGGAAGAQSGTTWFGDSNWQPRSTLDIDDVAPNYQASYWQDIPNGRPELALLGRPMPGTASAGGNGGYAAPPIAASPNPSGNPGGAGGTAGVSAGAGLLASSRGRYGVMGGSGGGGAGPSSSAPGEGGSDTVSTDNLIGTSTPSTSHFGSGGSGGSSPFGKGGLSGNPSNPSAGIGEDGRGYGSGGGGGYTGFAGGDGAPGIIILRY